MFTFLFIYLFRLALERSKTSEEAVDVITNLLEEYGQCGFSHESSPDLVYQNVFLIADANEAWVLETCGKNWVAQKISTGYRNISGCYSVETKFDKSSSNVISFAKEKGFWNGEVKFIIILCYCEKYIYI